MRQTKKAGAMAGLECVDWEVVLKHVSRKWEPVSGKRHA